MNDIRQKEARKTAYIDEELMGNKVGRKVFKSSAYSLGIAIGFLILSPLLPEIGDKEQSEAMFGLFHVLAYWMIAYSIVVAVSFLFLRPKINMILMMLNWMLMPMIAIWALLQIKDILSGHAG